MKFSSVRFLARANIKGNKRGNLIVGIMFFMVISLALIPCFSITVTNSVNERKDDFRSRCLELDPWDKELTIDALDSIRKINHVQEVDMLQGMRDIGFDLIEIDDENANNAQKQSFTVPENANIITMSLIGSEKRNVIAGDSLDESPEYSCIVPNTIDLSSGSENDDSDYIDGKSLIGKTLVVTTSETNKFALLYNYFNNEQSGNEWVSLPSLVFKLKVVGTYYKSPTSFGYGGTVFVSEKTGKSIVEQELKAGGYDLNSDKSDVEKWWSTPSLRTHYVVVDKYDNISYVYNEVSKMGYTCANDPELGTSESVFIMANILNVASSVLVIAPVVLFIFIIIQSIVFNIKNRKGEIGLLKSVGYKDTQIFLTMFFEEFTLIFRGFLIGGAFSAVFIAVANLINCNSESYVNRLYIVKWSDFITLLVVSLVIAMFILFLCQLITVKKITKIQPKDAMYDN